MSKRTPTQNPSEVKDRRKRQTARNYGIWMEHLAALSLRLKGYRIIARNERNKLGEIDIIARKGELIAIVEVKARNSVQAAVDAVGYHSRQRIIGAANLWLSKQSRGAHFSLRFDIVAVCPWQWPVHLENAF